MRFEPIKAPDGPEKYSGKIFSVREITIEKDGEETKKDIIIHPGAVVILPLLPGPKIVLVKNKRWPINKRLWEIPAGTLKKGENKKKGAYRELREETGYSTDLKNFDPVGELFTTAGWTNHRLLVYVATKLIPGKKKLEKDEDIIKEKFNLKEIRKMLNNNEIVDTKTIALLEMFLAKRGLLAGLKYQNYK